MFGEGRFDLAELDAIAADLHLVVEAAEIVDAAVGAVPRTVAGLVEPRALLCRKWVRQESFGGEIRTSDVAARDAGAADEHLAGHADRHAFEIAVEDVHLQVRDRLADRHGAFGRSVDNVGRVVHAAADDGFRRTVFVDQARSRRLVAPELQARVMERFAANDERVDVSSEIVLRQALLEHLQVGGRQLQQAEAARVANNVRELVDVGARIEQRDRTAGDERQIEAGDRQIEAERRVHRRAVASDGLVRVRGPLQVVAEAAMVNHRAFRLARGSGRVDDVGEVVAVDGDVQIRVVVLCDVGPFDIETHLARLRADPSTLVLSRVEGRPEGPNLLARAPRREHDRDTGVRRHVVQALERIRGIERHVRGARFQDAEKRDDHLDRSLDADADAGLCVGAELAQMSCEPVGAPVQVGEAHALVSGGDRDRMWGLLDLPLEQIDDRQRRELARRFVPADDLLAFRGGQQRHRGEPLFRFGSNRLEDRDVVRQDALNRLRLEQIGVVFEDAGNVAAALAQVQIQIELRRAGVQRHERRAEAGHLHVGLRRVVQREHHLEQRRPAQVAFGLQLFDELLERQILMRVCVEADPADARQRVAEGRIAVQIAPQDQRVDEEADETLDFGAVAVGHRRSDGEVQTAGVARQQHVEAGEQRHEERHALAAAQLLQRAGQRRRQFERHGGAVERLHRGPRAIGRQFQDLHALQLPFPVGELPIVDFVGEPLPLPHGVVGVLHGQLGKQMRRLRPV